MAYDGFTAKQLSRIVRYHEWTIHHICRKLNIPYRVEGKRRIYDAKACYEKIINQPIDDIQYFAFRKGIDDRSSYWSEDE